MDITLDILFQAEGQYDKGNTREKHRGEEAHQHLRKVAGYEMRLCCREAQKSGCESEGLERRQGEN